MTINITTKFAIGDTVWYLCGTQFMHDTVSRIEVSGFALSKRETGEPSFRYRLEGRTSTYTDSELYASPEEIVKKVAANAKQLKSNLKSSITS